MNILYSLVRILCESIKCNHNDIADYFKNKMLELTQIDIDNDKKNKKIDNFILKETIIQDNYKRTMGIIDYINNMESIYYKNAEVDDVMENCNNIDEMIADSIFGSYNYYCFPDKVCNDKNLIFFCEYDYNYLVKAFINEKLIDINTIIVFNYLSLMTLL